MKINNYKIDKNNFYINDVLFINAPSFIRKFLVIDNRIILLLKEKTLDNDRNIYCYDFRGNLFWIVSEVVKIHDENYFTNIYIGENDELKAYNLNGIEVTISINNGQIIKAELVK